MYYYFQMKLDSNRKNYLKASEFIDWEHPEIKVLAEKLVRNSTSKTGTLRENDLVKASFEWVRDNIKHSAEFKLNPITCKASDVLAYKTGYCYAKSHLLAALLRAQQIPAGFCYQRLSLENSGPPYCLHGLNAVYLENYGWYRLDARGNKEGVNAQFTPPDECLAFSTTDKSEIDLPEIWSDPLPQVVEVLQSFKTVDEVYSNLPDVQLIQGDMG